MKLSNAKHSHINKPFLKTDDVDVTTLKEGNRIIGFEARHKKETQVFNVKNSKIKKAWQTMESWFARKK